MRRYILVLFLSLALFIPIATPKYSVADFIVEGDMLLIEQELRAYVVTRDRGETRIGPELIVNRHNGELDYWVEWQDAPLRRYINVDPSYDPKSVVHYFWGELGTLISV